jgi:hypothetical protein
MGGVLGQVINGYSYFISNASGSLNTSMIIKRSHCHFKLKKNELEIQEIDAVT